MHSPAMMIRSFFTETLPSVLLAGEGAASSAAAVPAWQVVGALAALSCCVTIPAAQYRPLYGFTVGYGASVGWIGIYLWRLLGANKANAMLISSPNRLLPLTAAFYGIRLATYLLVRDLGGWKPRKEIKPTSRLSRVPFAVSLSILYGCLTCPLVYVIRHPAQPDSWAEAAAIIASHMACVATLLEAIADAHKFICKDRANSKSSNPPKSSANDGETKAATFVGPTGGLYGITRHPNYGAEILYWTAVYVCGMPSYGYNGGAWIASTIGWVSIVTIMVGSTKRLEVNQRKSYQDQPMYKEWVQQVPYPLIPGIE